MNRLIKEHPILFSTPMIRAILDGRKTQTRRIIKKQPQRQLFPCGTGKEYWAYDPHDLRAEYFHHDYGEIGSILWVRETFAMSFDTEDHPELIDNMQEIWDAGYVYKADGKPFYMIDKWKPPIFMPKEACRIWLEITDIRVERLWDISEEDAMNEGINFPNYAEQAIKDVHYPEPSVIYADLWDSINGKGSWEKNPWVWVISFKQIDNG